MPDLYVQQQQRASGILLRGGLIVVISLFALLGPEAYFLDALIAVCAVGVMSGLHELNIAKRQHGIGHPLWWLTLLNALSMMTFGIATFATLFVPFGILVAVSVSWFVGYAVCLGIAASALREQATVERVLVTVGLLHAALSGLVSLSPVYPRLSILALPAMGAFYAMMFGVWQLVIAYYLFRHAPQGFMGPTELSGDGRNYVQPIRVLSREEGNAGGQVAPSTRRN